MPRYYKRPKCEPYSSIPDLDSFSIEMLADFASRYKNPSIEDAERMLGNLKGFKKCAKNLGFYAENRAKALEAQAQIDRVTTSPESWEYKLSQYDIVSIAAAYKRDVDHFLLRAETIYTSLPKWAQWRETSYPDTQIGNYVVQRTDVDVVVLQVGTHKSLFYLTCPDPECATNLHTQIVKLLSTIESTNGS